MKLLGARRSLCAFRGSAFALGLAACTAVGCAIERTTAVDLVGGATGDAAAAAPEASTRVDASESADAADATGGDDGGSSVPADASDGAPAAPSCTAPILMTSDPNNSWQNGGYLVRNNVWNAAAGPGPQTLYACSYQSWYVVSDQTDDGGAVESYPNVQMNFADVAIGSLHGLTSTFSETGPGTGVYEYAFDLWLNGVAVKGSTQILVWVDSHGRKPDGSQMGTATFGGRTYEVWITPDGLHIVLEATETFTSGGVDLLEIIDGAVMKGWLTSSSTLGQVDFGVEIVSSGGAPAVYQVNAFSITAN